MSTIGNFDGESGQQRSLASIPWREYLEEKNYNKDINSMCDLCRKDQIKKYGEITIKCTGLLSSRNMIPEQYQHMFSDEEKDTMEEAINPYYWAEKNIDVHSTNLSTKIFMKRWYQEQYTRCLHEDSMVSMADGTYKKIKDVDIGESVVSYNEIKRTTPINKITNKWNNGHKEVYRIRLENGDQLDVTGNHPILSHFKDGKENDMFECKSYKTVYKSIDEGLSVGMDVYTVNKNHTFGLFNDIDIAKLLGYIVTDGYIDIKKSKIQFANTRREYAEEFLDIVLRLFDCSAKIKTIPASVKNGISRKETYSVCVYDAANLKKFLLDIGCIDKTTREMSILNFAYTMSSKALGVFINRAYSGDGCIHTNNAEHKGSTISFHGAIGEFIPAWRMLLRKIGIFSVKVRTSHRDTGNSMSCAISRSDDIKRFFEFVGPIFGKEEQSKVALNNAKCKTHNIKKSGRFLTTTRTKIIGIERLGLKQVYDIEVKNRHNFVANNIVVHNCSAPRKAIRAGRRAGKALWIETPIPTPNGFKLMRNITEGDIVFDENGEQCIVLEATEEMLDHDCYKVEFNDGTHLIADKEHIWSVETKSIRKNNSRRKGSRLPLINITTEEMINNLNVGTKQESNYSIPLTKEVIFTNNDIELPIDPYIFGYWLGDGDSQRGYFTIGDQDIENFRNIAINIGEDFQKAGIEKYAYKIKNLTTRLTKLNVNKNKHIPDVYKYASVSQRYQLLRGLMDSDGESDTNGVAEFCNTNHKLANDTYELISSLGIRASISKNKSYLYGKECADRYRIYINTNKKIFNLERKQRNINTKETYAQKNRYITNITKVDSVPVKCIAVSSKSNLYLAGHQYVPTHNTEGIVIALLHKLLTNEKYNVLVVTPYDSQAEEIYSKAKRILSNLNTPYEELVESARESPNYQIKFKNGSKLKAFTAGNSGAAQVRGQPANLIYIDETDLLGQKDFNSILAILLDKADTEFWVSSTPDGEKQMYRLSQDKAYKEFHFPSFVLPHYTDDLDNDMRSQSDEMGYVQEVMAEFGTSRAGVFQKYYVDRCSNIDYSRTQEEVISNRANYIITMGCDWNHEGIGTRIVALAYDRTDGLFFILDKAMVSKEGWTQTSAMEKIIEFNRRYRFDKIYVDRGFGYTQIEMLKSFAISQFGKLPPNHPDLFLAEIVGIDFGSKLEVKDPYSGADVKKDVKPYMVETLNRIIEKVLIKFDKVADKAVMEQLKGYQEKRSVSGRPTYSASSAIIGDHDLDALMLASFAYNVEYSDIFANMKSTLAIRILSTEDMYGKNMSHLNPSTTNNETNLDNQLDIRGKKRENYSPSNRTAYASSTPRVAQEKGVGTEMRVSNNNVYAGHTIMNGRSKANTRASFK